MRGTFENGLITRRRFVMTTSSIGAIAMAGCEGPESPAGDDEFTEAQAYGSLAEAVAVTSKPWSKTALDRARSIHNTIVESLEDLLKRWTSEKAAFRGIVEATLDAFKTLETGEEALDMENIRTQFKRRMPNYGDEIKSRLSNTGVTYDSSRPFYPLFKAIQDGAEAVAQDLSEQTKAQFAEIAAEVEFLLNQHYWPAFTSASADGWFVTGLEYSLTFLEDICKQAQS